MELSVRYKILLVKINIFHLFGCTVSLQKKQPIKQTMLRQEVRRSSDIWFYSLFRTLYVD
jgi:hypothetical protein